MGSGKTFTLDEAREIGRTIGIDWDAAPFDVEQFRMGLDVELEHGARDPETNVTGDDPILTGKIALAHLREFPDYYTRLARHGGRGRRQGLSTGDAGGGVRPAPACLDVTRHGTSGVARIDNLAGDRTPDPSHPVSVTIYCDEVF